MESPTNEKIKTKSRIIKGEQDHFFHFQGIGSAVCAAFKFCFLQGIWFDLLDRKRCTAFFTSNIADFDALAADRAFGMGAAILSFPHTINSYSAAAD